MWMWLLFYMGIGMVGSSPKRKWLETVEGVWNETWFGYLLAAMFAAILALFIIWVPPSGYAITAMAVIAGIMALRQGIGGRERFFWFALLLAFMVVEIRAINHDQIDRNEKFEKIAGGLQTAIKEVGENLKTVTGGDSFVYLGFSGISETNADIVAISQGKYPLYGVSVGIIDAKYLTHSKDVSGSNLGQKNIGDMGTSVAQGLGSMRFKVAGDKQDLNVFFHGRNGFWTELIRIRKVRGTWVTATVVFGKLDVQQFPNGARLLQDIQKDFPVRELEIDSDWQNTQKLPKAF